MLRRSLFFIVTLFFSCFSLFCQDPIEMEKIIKQFLERGKYIKSSYTLYNDKMTFIYPKNGISAFLFTSLGFGISTHGRECDDLFLYENFNISIDKDGNILITEK